MTNELVIKATIRMGPWQRGQSRGSADHVLTLIGDMSGRGGPRLRREASGFAARRASDPFQGIKDLEVALKEGMELAALVDESGGRVLGVKKEGALPRDETLWIAPHRETALNIHDLGHGSQVFCASVPSLRAFLWAIRASFSLTPRSSPGHS